MSDRLEELRRQRALIQEQLAWIDREIAALDGKTVAMPAVPTPTPPAPARIAPSLPRPMAPPVPVPLPSFPEYEPNAASMERDAKRGCLAYAIMGFVVLFAILAAIYFVAYRDHPLFRAEKPSASEPKK